MSALGRGLRSGSGSAVRSILNYGVHSLSHREFVCRRAESLLSDDSQTAGMWPDVAVSALGIYRHANELCGSTSESTRTVRVSTAWN